MTDTLYIIGNGFDIFSGLKTRYVDFRVWLELNYPFIYENLTDAYGTDGELWNDFEQKLGELDIKRFVELYDPCRNSNESVFEQVKKRREFEEKNMISHSQYFDNPCSRRLRGLLDVLQYCFEKWVSGINAIWDPKYTYIQSEDSYFINFNYTDTLRWLYGIPEERILHIHGCASKHEHLVFGHNKYPHADIFDGTDAEKVCEVLQKYHKNPSEQIFKHDDLATIIKYVEKVCIYGLSFSSVDEDYLDWFVSQTPISSQWEISWFSTKDKERINDFILRHWTLMDRCKLIQLKEEK